MHNALLFSGDPVESVGSAPLADSALRLLKGPTASKGPYYI